MTIYLCSPFSHPDPAVRRRRFKAACQATAALLRAGIEAFSPIAFTYPVAAQGLDPMDHDFWMRVDKPYLEWARMIMVLRLDGWRESRGVNMEIAQARAIGKPVSFICPADLGVRDVPLSHKSTPAAWTGVGEGRK